MNTKEMAHTQGPWTADPWEHFGTKGWSIRPHRKEDGGITGFQIACCEGESGVNGCPPSTEFMGGTTKGNAFLIAAAPDLLFVAKLDQGIEDKEAWAHEWCEDRALDHETQREVLTRVRRAAIAKAEAR